MILIIIEKKKYSDEKDNKKCIEKYSKIKEGKR